MVQKQGKGDFTEELQPVVERVSMCFGDTLPSGLRPSVSSSDRHTLMKQHAKGSSVIHFAKLPLHAV